MRHEMNVTAAMIINELEGNPTKSIVMQISTIQG